MKSNFWYNLCLVHVVHKNFMIADYRKRGVLTKMIAHVIVSNLGGIFLIAIKIGTYLKININSVFIIMW